MSPSLNPRRRDSHIHTSHQDEEVKVIAARERFLISAGISSPRHSRGLSTMPPQRRSRRRRQTACAVSSSLLICTKVVLTVLVVLTSTSPRHSHASASASASASAPTDTSRETNKTTHPPPVPLSQWCPSRLKNNTSPPLRKWLKQNFVPHFADVQFGSTNVHVDMKNTTCANIAVGHITPTSSSDNATTTRLGIRIDNLATSCSSDVAVHVVLLGDHTGHATVTIAGTSVDVTLELTGEASQLPRHMSLKHCTASVTQIQVVLSGLNLPKAITNDVQKLISNEARKYVHDKLCDYVTPKVASAGEDALARLDA